ncbi:MAG: hypothetical protein UD286_01820 [Bacteroidales bacterium]|nr:hypothetical protein [Bacteroidales bacterium]
MKKIFAAISLSVLVLSVSSCDLFRSLAGRPTSAELKSAIEKQQSSAQQMQAITEEPAETTQQTAPEETIAVASPQAKKEEYTMVKREGRMSVPLAYTHTNSTLKATPEHSYYIIVGTYRQRPTLNKMIKDAHDAGYETFLLEYSNGLTSVGLMPCDNLGEAIDAYAKVSKEDFCPKDACILIAK